MAHCLRRFSCPAQLQPAPRLPTGRAFFVPLRVSGRLEGPGPGSVLPSDDSRVSTAAWWVHHALN